MCYDYKNKKKSKVEEPGSILDTISERSSENGDKYQVQDSELPSSLSLSDADKNENQRLVELSQQRPSLIAGVTN